MTEWTIVTVIAALSGLVISFVKPMVTLNGTLTRLADAVAVLERELKEISDRNREAHGRLWEKVAEQDEHLQGHEARIARLEAGAGKAE